jgi:hypothetical protein
MANSLEDMTVDQLLAHARTTSQSHNLLQSLMSDPASRELVQRQMKKANPALVIPEIDTADRVRSEIQKEREARQALEQKILERDVRDSLERQRASVKSKYGLNDADMTEVEKMMTDPDDQARIPTYDAAARVHKASKQTATPTYSSIAPPTFDMPETSVWGKGIGNSAALNKIALNEAYAAINDIRGGKVAGMGPAVQN